MLIPRPRAVSVLRAAFCTAVFASAGSAGVASEHAAIAQATAELPIVRVATTPADDMTSMLYAERSGLFRRAGLDVRVERQSSSGAAIAAAVLGGSFDVGKASLTDIITAHQKGLPFVVIAPAALYDSAVPFGGIIVAKDSTIVSGKDLNGKFIAEPALRDIGAVALNAWMDQNGGDWRSIRYIEMPMSAIPVAIEQHRIDGGESVYPILAAALATGNVRMIPTYSAVAPTFIFSGWIATRDWVNQHRQVVKTLAAVLAQSAAYTNAHRAETAGMVADFTSIPLATIQNMPRVTNGTVLSASLIQPLIAAGVRDQSIPRAFPAQELFDRSLVP